MGEYEIGTDGVVELTRDLGMDDVADRLVLFQERIEPCQCENDEHYIIDLDGIMDEVHPGTVLPVVFGISMVHEHEFCPEASKEEWHG